MKDHKYNPNTNKNEFVISFSLDLTRKLRAMAAAEGKSVQSVIREAVKAFISEEENKNDSSNHRSKN